MNRFRTVAAVILVIAATMTIGRMLTPQIHVPVKRPTLVTYPSNPANTNINGGPTARCYGNATYLGTSSEYPTGECGTYQP